MNEKEIIKETVARLNDRSKNWLLMDLLEQLIIFDKQIYIDDENIMRWEGSGKEIING